MDDIRFWSRQLAEHALFLHLGLEVEPYKSRAGDLYQHWIALLDELRSTESTEAAKGMLWRPVVDLARFKQAVLDRQRAGEWLGWLFPLFVDHVLRELQYFVARVWGGGLPPTETYCDNVTFMREHAEFAAHLLDPSATELIAPAEGLAEAFASLKPGCAGLTPGYVTLGRQAGRDLDAYLRTQPVSAASGRSVIHPVLAEHVIREGERFLQTMDELSTEREPLQ